MSVMQEARQKLLAEDDPQINVCGYLTIDLLELILEILNVRGRIRIYGVTEAPSLYGISAELLKGITVKVGESSVIITSNDVNSAKDNS